MQGTLKQGLQALVSALEAAKQNLDPWGMASFALLCGAAKC